MGPDDFIFVALVVLYTVGFAWVANLVYDEEVHEMPYGLLAAAAIGLVWPLFLLATAIGRMAKKD